MGDDDKERAVDELMRQLSTPEKLVFAADMLGQADAEFQRLLLKLAALRAQRDEARELVRRYVDAEMDPTDEDGDGRRGSFKASRNAVARWDEEAKRSGSKALREWTERGEADIARWVEEEKKR